MKLTNPTPFVMDRLVLLDKRAAEHLVVVLKATWSISETGELSVCDEQPPLRVVDEFHGEPDSSSISREAEVGPAKRSTDVFLVGSAVAPRSSTQSLDVAFRVGPVTQQARVYGDRFWRGFGRFSWKSAPEPFERILLIWENAFGGKDMSPRRPSHFGQEARNPVGKGFRVRRSRQKLSGTPLPNIEHPGAPLRRPRSRALPVGFGPIGRDWKPRLDFAGTYDQRWMDERAPLLPLDFDERFHSSAPSELVAPQHLAGGEAVEVIGCTPGRRLSFSLPRLDPSVRVHFSSDQEEQRLNMDSVTVDTDEMLLSLVFKADLDVHRRVLEVREIEARLGGEV